MVYNQTTYPEYNANTQDDTYPDTANSDFRWMGVIRYKQKKREYCKVSTSI